MIADIDRQNEIITWYNSSYRADRDSQQRIYVWKMWYVESMDTSTLKEEDINRIYEIEQDMWSHGTGLYISCNDCGNISSKLDVYGHLAKNIQLEIVSNLEKIYDIGCPDCPKCQSKNTKHIYDESYKEEIAWRYEFDESFLTVFKDISWRIQGFCNAYISDFDTIYTKDFAPYYTEKNQEVIKNKVCELLHNNMPEKFICMNNLWATQRYATLPLMYQLIKSLCEIMLSSGWNLHGIYDSILWNATNGIYTVSWWQQLKMTTSLNPNITNENFLTDVMFHQNILHNFLHTFWGSSRYFFKQYFKEIKSIVKSQKMNMIT